MEVRHGSGAFISSKEKAQQFLETYKDVNSLQDLKSKLHQSIQRQEEEFANFSQLLNQLLSRTKDVQQRFPFNPYEIQLSADAINLGKSINELNIWHSTGATIVAVQQGDQLLISPGPYTKLEAGNTIYFVGNELSVGLMHNLFFNEIETNKWNSACFFFVKKQNRQANPLSDKVFMTFRNIPENHSPFFIIAEKGRSDSLLGLTKWPHSVILWWSFKWQLIKINM